MTYARRGGDNTITLQRVAFLCSPSSILVVVEIPVQQQLNLLPFRKKGWSPVGQWTGGREGRSRNTLMLRGTRTIPCRPRRILRRRGGGRGLARRTTRITHTLTHLLYISYTTPILTTPRPLDCSSRAPFASRWCCTPRSGPRNAAVQSGRHPAVIRAPPQALGLLLLETHSLAH
jgi:hypothetical protein